MDLEGRFQYHPKVQKILFKKKYIYVLICSGHVGSGKSEEQRFKSINF